AVAAALLVDRLIGEPPVRPHPVAAFGSMMQAVERRLYGDSRVRGVVHAAIGSGAGMVAGTALRSTALSTYVTVAGRGLGDAATAVQRALIDSDVGSARQLLPALVGRDPSTLDEKEIARAVVESVAENTVDAVIAPTLW